MAVSSNAASEPWVELVLVSLITCCALLLLGIQPILIGDLIAEGRATLAQANLIASVDYFVIGAATLSAPILLAKVPTSLIGLVSGLTYAIGNGLTLWLVGDDIIPAQVMAALGAGTLLWLQTAYIARSARAERLSGIFLAVFVAASIALSLVGSTAVFPTFGSRGLYCALAFLGVIVAVFAYLRPIAVARSSSPTSTRESGSGSPLVFSFAAVMTLVSVFLFNAFSADVWVAFEPITAAAGISHGTSDFAAIGSLAMQGVGALMAGWLASRVSAPLALVVIGFITIAQGLYLHLGTITQTGFLVFALIYGWLGYAVVPFQIGMLIKTDPSRRAASLFAAPWILGAAFGPLVTSSLRSDKQVSGGLELALVWSILSLIALALAIRSSRSVNHRMIEA